MRNLFTELKRRNVSRVAILYIVSAWLLLQVSDVLISIANLPAWVGTTILLILSAGLPITLAISWFFELTPDGWQRESKELTHDPTAGRRIDFIIIGILAAAVLVLVADNYLLNQKTDPGVSTLVQDQASIAVLPFKNTSESVEKADFFAAGIHDDLLTALAKLKGLKVISRTSVMEYRASTKNMREIGRELGARTIMEGSVQRAGDTLRINAQLIDAQTDQHLWAETFDRQLNTANIFAIQSEIAASIATALHLTLSSDELTRISSVPTANLAAYDLFLKARAAANRAVTTRESFEEALDRFEAVVEEDPNFALAHAERGMLQAKSFWWGFDPDREHIKGARDSVERALELQPDLPEGRLAMGYFHYWSARDYPRALSEFMAAEQGMPGDHRIFLARSYIERRLGQWEDTLANMQRAIELSPRDGEMLRQLSQTHELLREYDTAMELYERGQQLAPELVSLYWGEAFIPIFRDADTSKMWELVRNPPIAMAGTRYFGGWQAARIDGNTEEALSFLDLMGGGFIEDQDQYWPMSFVRGYTWLLAGNDERADSLFREALGWLIERSVTHPEDVRIYPALGTVYAALGERDKALEAAARVEELVPYERDQFLGARFHWHTLMVYAVLGDLERTVAGLDKYLSRPGYYSANAIEKLPRFAAFRNAPEFQAVVEKFRN